MSQQQLQALFSNLDDLRALVGRQVRYLGETYTITDLLAEESILILSSECNESVQDDSFGRAHRMVPEQQRLRFRDAAGNPTAIWEDFSFLDGAL